MPWWPTAAFAPGGLENNWEFNGFKMGSGGVSPSGQSAFSGFSSSFWTASDLILLNEIGGLDDADLRTSSEVRSGLHGEIAKPAFYAGRTVTLQGELWAANMTNMRIMQQVMRTAFRDLVELPLYGRYDMSDSTRDYYVNCRKTSPLAMKETVKNPQTGRWKRDFLVTLRASDPRFLSVSTTTTQTNFSSSGGSNPLTNSGNWWEYPTVVLRANAGVDVSGPLSVSDGTNTLQLGTTITSGSFITIDTFNHDIRNASGVSIFGDWISPSTWPVLGPGTSTYSFDCFAGNGRADVTYHNVWM